MRCCWEATACRSRARRIRPGAGPRVLPLREVVALRSLGVRFSRKNDARPCSASHCQAWVAIFLGLKNEPRCRSFQNGQIRQIVAVQESPCSLVPAIRRCDECCRLRFCNMPTRNAPAIQVVITTDAGAPMRFLAYPLGGPGPRTSGATARNFPRPRADSAKNRS